MKRSKPLKADPAKTRAWQARGAKKYADRDRDTPVAPRPQKRAQKVTRKPRRNDSAWRDAVMERRGARCASCGTVHHVQADHIWPRGQGGPSHVMNGLPLCGEFGNDCHGKKTRSELVIEHSWLDDEQRAWLAQVGWVAWDEDGEPYGRGMRHFGPRRVRGRQIRRVEHDGEG